LLFIYVHRKALLIGMAVLFALYLFNASSKTADGPPLVRDSVKLCRDLDRYNDRWREREIGYRVSRALELQEKSLKESSIFQTPVAELVQAEVEGETGVSIAIRRDLSRLCDQEAGPPLPP